MRKYLPIAFVTVLFMLCHATYGQVAPPKPRDTTIKGPQTFAMIMGISSYKYVRPLAYADKDAEMFRDFLKSPGGGSIPDDNIFCLLNEEAISSTFWTKGWKWLTAKKLQQGDRLFIYLAGHGDAIDEDQFFYIAYDCNPAGDKNNYLAGGVIQLYNLKLKIQRETGKGVEVYFIMDACRSNELPGGQDGQNFLNSAISEYRAGEIIMLATGAGQESLEDASIGSGHGLFTYYLVDGLTGAADSAGVVDNKITLAEIQKYIDKNVPQIAENVFRRKQDPFFCCNESSEKVVSVVDTAYLRKWQKTKALQKNLGTSAVAPRSRNILRGGKIDTLLIETYNRFNKEIRDNNLIGKLSAEYYYDQMEKKYPGNPYTVDAQATLAVEFINFAQTKINLYLDCRDATSIQKLRAQIDEDEKTDEINTSLTRMEKVARQEFYEVGYMLERAVNFIMPDDPEFAKSLLGRMYFFKARGYFGQGRQLVDIKTAFEYIYKAYATDKNAAYILNTLSSLHLDNHSLDSAIFYAKKAIVAAPKWRYPYVTLAFSYKTLNRPDSAIKYYRKSIEVDPGNSDAYVDLGHFYYSISNTDSAIANYERALRIQPNNVYASNNIGWLYHDKKVYDKSIEYFKKSIKADSRVINAYNGLAKTFFELKEFDSARIYYSKAFDHYPDKSIVNVYIGNFYKELKEYDSAKAYYRLAVEMDPDYEDAYNNLGRTSFTMKEYDSAKYYYLKAIQTNPYSAFAFINMGMVFKELKEADSTYSYFQKAIKLEPKNPSILNTLGVIYGQDKLYDSAKGYFRKALNVKPDYKPAFNNLQKIFRDLNELDSITNFLKDVSLYDPGSAFFMNDIGLAFLDQKRYDSAGKYFRDGLKKEPNNPQLLNNLGMVFQGTKKYDSAKVYVQKAINAEPDNPTYLSNLAGIFKQLKNGDSAAYYYKKQVLQRIDPGAQEFFAIGGFFEDLKMYDSAMIYLKTALGNGKGYVPPYTEIGGIFMKMEMYDSALFYFREAARLDTQSYTPTLNLGLAYRMVGKYDSAIVYIQKAIRINPLKAKTYYQLACCYALNDKPEQAILYLRQAYERGYKNKEALLIDPDLEGLKNHKAFQDLLDKYIPDWRKR
ncbi:MAG TPA: tetratricopeptide repeat protein [Chitinophagaceae bacterium]|nr:tetratricopeptide repeat protein [Chitinophagaceae bacterium]